MFPPHLEIKETGEVELLIQSKFAWELCLPEHKLAQNKWIFPMLLQRYMLCSCAVVGFAARLLHTATSTSSQCKVLRGRENRGQKQWGLQTASGTISQPGDFGHGAN